MAGNYTYPELTPECACAAEADFLVTGNLRHFPLTEFQGIRILEPSGFAQVLADILLE
jgi:hypothetical protein